MFSERGVSFSREPNALLAGGCVAVPNVVMLSPRLRAGEKILYALILDYAQNQTTGLTEELLQEDLGCDERQLRAWLLGLKSADLIRVERLESGEMKCEVLPLSDSLFGRGGLKGA